MDARRYSRLSLRVFTEEGGDLRFFHRQLTENTIHASEFLALEPGWQTLGLNLDSLHWHSRDLAPGSKQHPSSWGSEEGIVSMLRIDPVRQGAFRLDFVELSDPGSELPASAEIVPFTNVRDDLFITLRRDPGQLGFLAHDSGLAHTRNRANDAHEDRP